MKNWDGLGCAASSACAVHCAASPLLFFALPSFGEIWSHPASHVVMAVAVIPLALTVVFRRSRRNGERWVMGAALVGIALILASSVLPFLGTSELEEATEAQSTCTDCCPRVVTNVAGGPRIDVPPAAITSMLGSVFLVAAHLGNRRCGKRCQPPRGCFSCRSGEERGASV